MGLPRVFSQSFFPNETLLLVLPSSGSPREGFFANTSSTTRYTHKECVKSSISALIRGPQSYISINRYQHGVDRPPRSQKTWTRHAKRILAVARGVHVWKRGGVFSCFVSGFQWIGMMEKRRRKKKVNHSPPSLVARDSCATPLGDS